MSKTKNIIVKVPELPPKNPMRPIFATRAEGNVAIEQISHNELIETLLKYYPDEGDRHRFTASLAGYLYDLGLSPAAIAGIIYDLALRAKDEEAENREKNAWAICDRIDNNQKAPRIGVLIDEYEFSDMETVEKILGLDDGKIDKKIEALDNKSPKDKIEDILKSVVRCDKSEQIFYIEAICDVTTKKKGYIKALFEKIQRDMSPPPVDLEYWLAEKTANDCYTGGKHILRYKDKSIWKYGEAHWGRTSDDIVRKNMTELFVKVRAENHSLASEKMNPILKGAMDHLHPMIAREGDVLRLVEEPYPVINCHNCEVWIDSDGKIQVRPHSSESYQTYRLEVDYDQDAKCPLLEETLLEIFSASSNAKDMSRHFMELFGYAIQPRRDLAGFWLLKGQGRNSKSQLIKLIIKMLNPRSVISDRIDSIEREHFKLGSMAGKLLLVDEDVAVNAKLDDGFLKKTSEANLLSGQLKGKDQFEFVSRVLPIMLSNHWPPIPDYSLGFERRAMVIPFDYVIPEDKVDLKRFDNIWEQERSGVLNLAIQSYRNLRQRGKFLLPHDCVEARQKWFVAGASSLTSFLDEVCDNKYKGKNQLFSEFHARYCSYVELRRLKQPYSKERVKTLLTMLNVEFGITDGADTIKGLYARDPNDIVPM